MKNKKHLFPFVTENLTFLSLILVALSTGTFKSVVLFWVSFGIVILTVFLFTYRLHQLLKLQDSSTKKSILKKERPYVILLVVCFILLCSFWIK